MKYLDFWSAVVIVITFILFTAALFFTGLTHDLLLEAGVFLVSVKLIMMAHNNSKNSGKLEAELQEIKQLIKQNNEQV
jgi:hypothetical protein